MRNWLDSFSVQLPTSNTPTTITTHMNSDFQPPNEPYELRFPTTNEPYELRLLPPSFSAMVRQVGRYPAPTQQKLGISISV